LETSKKGVIMNWSKSSVSVAVMMLAASAAPVFADGVRTLNADEMDAVTAGSAPPAAVAVSTAEAVGDVVMTTTTTLTEIRGHVAESAPSAAATFGVLAGGTSIAFGSGAGGTHNADVQLLSTVPGANTIGTSIENTVVGPSLTLTTKAEYTIGGVGLDPFFILLDRAGITLP
jgi:hypothetical protein